MSDARVERLRTRLTQLVNRAEILVWQSWSGGPERTDRPSTEYYWQVWVEGWPEGTRHMLHFDTTDELEDWLKREGWL